MNQLTVECKTEGCSMLLLIDERGVEKIGSSFRFPVPVGTWTRIYRCPECEKENVYSQNDVRDARGFPV